MRRMLGIGLVLAVAGALAGGAWSATPPSPLERKLQKDVAALKAQVKALQATVKKLQSQESDLEGIAGAGLLVSACSAAITADALQGTWQVVDQISAATQAGKTYFGAQTPVDDRLAGTSVCQSARITRSQAVPPTTAAFSALFTLLHT